MGKAFSPDLSPGDPLLLSALANCEVVALQVCQTVDAQELQQCRLFVGACQGVATIKGCTDCVFTVACKQLRVQDCERCTFYLHTTTVPAIARCTNLLFAPFNGSYPRLQDHWITALIASENRWCDIFDQTPPESSSLVRNWQLLTAGSNEDDPNCKTVSLIADGFTTGTCSHNLTPLQCEKMREIFFMFDKDRDGKLNEDEASLLVKTCAEAGWDQQVSCDWFSLS